MLIGVPTARLDSVWRGGSCRSRRAVRRGGKVLGVVVVQSGRMGTEWGPLDWPRNWPSLKQCLEGPYSVRADDTWQRRKNGEAVNDVSRRLTGVK